MSEFIQGKTVVINQPSYSLYTIFSDPGRIAGVLPEQYRDKVSFGEDTVLIHVQGFELGVKVHSRTPFSKVEYEHYGQSPFPFFIAIFMEPASDSTTYFHIELTAELNMMMRMMLGGKLREAVDKITDAIANAAAGKMPDNMPQGWQDMMK